MSFHDQSSSKRSPNLLLIAFAVFGIVVLAGGGLAWYRFDQRQRSLVNWNLAAGTLATLKVGIEKSANDLGSYPAVNAGLAPLWDGSFGLGPYFDKSVPKADPWGRDWLYYIPGGSKTPVIGTLGEDGKAGGVGTSTDIIVPLTPMPN